MKNFTKKNRAAVVALRVVRNEKISTLQRKVAGEILDHIGNRGFPGRPADFIPEAGREGGEGGSKLRQTGYWSNGSQINPES